MEFSGRDAIERLRELPRLEIGAATHSSNDRGPDLTITLMSPSGATTYGAEVRSTLNASTVGTVISQLSEKTGHRPLLLAPYISSGVARQLQLANVEYVDSVGNMWLASEAIYARVAGNGPDKPTSSTLTVTDLKVAYALLAEPTLIEKTLREIAAGIVVSRGAVSNALRKLEQLGYLHRRKTSFFLLKPMRLLERWELGYAELLRKKLAPSHWRALPGVTLEALAEKIRNVKDVAIGGEGAAALMLPNSFTPATFTIHSFGIASKEVARALGLVQSPTGPAHVTIMGGLEPKKSENQRIGVQLADAVLVRAELLQIGDSRLEFVAQRLLDERIRPRLEIV